MLYRLLSVFVRRDVIVPLPVVLNGGSPATPKSGEDDPLAGLYGDLEHDLRAAGYLV
jgi:hypothetical protein